MSFIFQRKLMKKQKTGPLFKKVSVEEMSKFSWASTLAWGEKKAPVTMTFLRSMFPAAEDIQSQKFAGGKRSSR